MIHGIRRTILISVFSMKYSNHQGDTVWTRLVSGFHNKICSFEWRGSNIHARLGSQATQCEQGLCLDFTIKYVVLSGGAATLTQGWLMSGNAIFYWNGTTSLCLADIKLPARVGTIQLQHLWHLFPEPRPSNYSFYWILSRFWGRQFWTSIFYFLFLF